MFNSTELERYNRQIMLFGEEGQSKLKQATVLVAGLGGLGSPIAIYLAAAGIGKLKIVDFDNVDITNLNRQVLHYEKDITRMKVVSGQEKLQQLNPNIEIERVVTRIDENNIKSITEGIDVIVDAMDNYDTRFVLNSATVSKRIPLIHGAVSGLDGQVTTIIPGKSPCLKCLFTSTPPKEVFPILGTTAGIIGTIQANEVIKYITGKGELLVGQLLLWDGSSSGFEKISIMPNTNCDVCGHLHEE